MLENRRHCLHRFESCPCHNRSELRKRDRRPSDQAGFDAPVSLRFPSTSRNADNLGWFGCFAVGRVAAAVGCTTARAAGAWPADGRRLGRSNDDDRLGWGQRRLGPATVLGAFDAEGMRALSANCPRAAAVMFRAMLAALVRDQGSRAASRPAGSTSNSRRWPTSRRFTQVWWTGRPRSVLSATPVRIPRLWILSHLLRPKTSRSSADNYLRSCMRCPPGFVGLGQVHSGRRLGLALPYQRVASRP